MVCTRENDYETYFSQQQQQQQNQDLPQLQQQLFEENTRFARQLATLQENLQNFQQNLWNSEIPNNASLQSDNRRILVKLPPFWPEKPNLWFSQFDSQFILSGITNEVTKFHYVASHLDSRVAVEVEDIIENPSTENPYMVWTKLIDSH